MFNYNPVAAQPHHNHADKLITDKMMAHDPQLKQATADMQDKAVQALRKFPADSAYISDEAKKAFEEKDEIRRKEDYLKEKKKKKRQQNNSKFKAYQDAQEQEEA